MPETNNATAVSIPIAPALPKVHRLKRKQRTNSEVFGKIGFFILILMVVVFFVAIHSRQNEMVYVTLLFVFLAIALFSYGFWSAVNRGNGISQYVGKHDLQHQQVSNPKYHFSSVPSYKGHPKSRVHVVQPPKMGGVRLKIYTLSNDEQLRSGSLSGTDSDVQRGHCRHNLTSTASGSRIRSHHHHQHRHHHHHRHKDLDNAFQQKAYQQLGQSVITTTVCMQQSDRNVAQGQPRIEGDITSRLLTTPPLRTGQSCSSIPICMDDEDDAEPIKVEVNLSRSSSQQYRHRLKEGFEEVQLPQR